MRIFDLVLPAYNEGPALAQLVQRVVDAAHKANYKAEHFQLILVNNGSTDDTAAALQRLRTEPLAPWFRVVTLQHNTGYGAGLKAGLETTDAAFVGWSHADLQSDPADAFVALTRCQAATQPTLVKGTRRKRALRDRFVSAVFAGVAKSLLHLNTDEINAQPKVFPRALLNRLADAPPTFAFDLYMLYQAKKAGYVIETIQVDFPPRIHGTSKWASTFLRRHRTILNMVGYMVALRRGEGPL